MAQKQTEQNKSESRFRVNIKEYNRHGKKYFEAVMPGKLIP